MRALCNKDLMSVSFQWQRCLRPWSLVCQQQQTCKVLQEQLHKSDCTTLSPARLVSQWSPAQASSAPSSERMKHQR